MIDAWRVSASLQAFQRLGRGQAKVEKVEELFPLFNYGTKLLQISRSTPYLTTALIGHKSVCDTQHTLSVNMQGCLTL